MSFRISHVTFSEDEIEQAMDAAEAAFSDDSLNNYVLPTNVSDPDQLRERRQFRRERFKKRSGMTGSYAVKITDDSEAGGGILVGCSGWNGPGGEQWKAGAEEPVYPRCMNLDAWKSTAALIDAARKRHLGERTDVWYVNTLFVRPEYWGKGIGKMLVQWGIDRAREDGMSIYLEATPAGKVLYESLGFEVLEAVFVPGLEQDGQPYAFTIMMKDPKGRLRDNGDGSGVFSE